MRIIDGFKDARPNGYLESIRKGSAGVSRFRGGVYYGSGDRQQILPGSEKRSIQQMRS